ncbi:MAG TPA: hypothetical protein P5107_09695 [Thermotogota bacterium]|nr:hypothetical protein [Thermotogota bacterium]HRW35314.1 hypothetical protein [Thermotogota bacterium]
MSINITKTSVSDVEELTEMALDLWKDHDYDELKDMFHEALLNDDECIFISREQDDVTGFIHLTLRTDYVEGSNSSPVGYIEGIYENNRTEEPK